MASKRMSKAIILAVSLSLGLCVYGQPESSAASLAEQILGSDPAQRALALERVRSIMNELREALIEALAREAEARTQRHKASLMGKEFQPSDDPEFFARLTEAVIELHDPRSIDALVGVLGTGSTRTPIALADFGELAAPKVVAVAEASDNPFQVDHALIALRCMVEHIREQPLSDETLEKVSRVAEKRLTEPRLLASNGVILMKAIDLAVALGDPRLRKIVESIASDSDAVRSRGVQGSDLVERVQRHSADRLNGIPVLPSCD